ncbi:Fungal transcriptional regulatory protein [Cordyceps fumosorosea ARSEF 2679]|uniref:Fungal transcriptional regulatory protein n=1 Tax=Cordyceps fumosorosea (strain ARSEF 2679) TaxID=1081104 RepID=A0A167LYA6_CORFA|nr:Fungal transcriptional regulatory protein [Cordyceps fumosorosea ARSEF 2679]OAA53676.1 Fungal transcriptional regulatory protein [Cordyceps fumosorosea ARSEF 2679]
MPPARKKFAACDPCRAAKVACDHARPVCIRCQNQSRQGECVYRASPFKKTKRAPEKSTTPATPGLMSHTPSRQQSFTAANGRPSVLSGSDAVAPKSHRYPNPGYLGTFSSTTLFGNLPDMRDPVLGEGGEGGAGTGGVGSDNPVREANVTRGAGLIKQIEATVSIESCCGLIQAWTARGSSLPLAGPFLEHCISTMRQLFPEQGRRAVASVEVSRSLFHNTSRPIDTASGTTLHDFQEQFGHQRCRWETLGFFFTAASRAAIELSKFESAREYRDLQRLGMNLSDLSLDIALSLDCLNDLQLVLQYENWILHSFVDGDQSYHSWKRLGDVISSIYALGLHQQTNNDYNSLPPFLLELRRLTFSLTYFADKNVSIFLGRPPRIHLKYCKLILPRSDGRIVEPWRTTWPQDMPFDYVADIRWGALCGILKEDIMELFSAEGVHENHPKVKYAYCHTFVRPWRTVANNRHREIYDKATAQWQALPPHFRLETSLKQCHQAPVVRDFILNARLNQLHILFLLRMVVARSRPERDAELVSTAAEILGLIVEALMQKDSLVNSNTSLVWKVAYYGLSAAGVISLWLLHQSSASTSKLQPQPHPNVDTSRVFQSLSVLVAEMEKGVLIETDDPNYKLLLDASKTIGCLLRRLFQDRVAPPQIEEASGGGSGGVATAAAAAVAARSPTSAAAIAEMEDAAQDAGWNPWDGHTLQDFESDFWLNLAEHPFLAGGGGNEV